MWLKLHESIDLYTSDTQDVAMHHHAKWYARLFY